MSSFIKDERGISEEFTSLPALVVVMIGFALFFALIGGVYYSYNEKVSRVDKYETANFVLEKITSVEGSLAKAGVLKEGGVVDNETFNSLTGEDMTEIIEKSDVVGVEFGLRLNHEKMSGDIETPNIASAKDRVAASKEIPVYLNAAETVPGELTVIVWEA